MDNSATPKITWDAPKPEVAQSAAPPNAPKTPAIKWDQTANPAPQASAIKWDNVPAPQAQEAQPTRLPAGLHPDVQSTIDEVAKRKGIPVWALRAIGRLESGGQAHPESAASPAGAQGAMQLMPDTFKSVSKGNILNLRDNVEAGATYYRLLLKKYGDPIQAAGAYNAGPGRMDDYLKHGRALPAETVAYMANAAAMHTPIDETPLPQHVSNVSHGVAKLPQKRQPTQGKSNLDPEKARYEWYDQLFGHQDLPFVLDNATLADLIMPGAGHMQKALHLYAKNPAAAAAEYGDNARGMLLLQAEMGDDQVKNNPLTQFYRANARAMLANPVLAAGETAITEFFNPMSWLEGAGVGKGIGLASSILHQSRAGRAAAHMFSPYKDIVAAHGTNARNLIAQMGAHIAQADKPAMEVTQKVFGGLKHEVAHEVIRISQGSAPNAAHASNAADIASRAAILRADIAKRSAAKVAAKVLKPSQIKDVAKYFPMRGTAESPIYNDETMSFLDSLRPNIKGAAPATESIMHAKYDTFDEAVQRGVAPVDPAKFNAATQYYKFVKAGEQNIAFENGLRTMAAKHPDMIRFGAEAGGKPPVDKLGRQMVSMDQALGGAAQSPGLRDAWVSREFGEFFTRGKRAGASTISGVGDNELLNMNDLVHKLNSAQRAFIIANPGYHPIWNVAPNAAAATGAGLAGTLGNYARAIVGTAMSVGGLGEHLPGFAGKAVGAAHDAAVAKFMGGANGHAAGLAKAIAAGAEAHFGQSSKSMLGGDAIRLLTIAESELTPAEKLDRFATEAFNWNSHATFGPTGEGQFVSTVFKHFTEKMGMEPEDAAWATRGALGAYQNVDPNSWASKLMMFYPWLKGNVPFWLLHFAQNPKLARAITTGVHRQNEERGDPNVDNAMNRRNPDQVYLGRDAHGREINWTVPFPFKDAEKVGEIVAPGPRDFNQRVQVTEEIVGSRLKVLPSIGLNTVGTLFNQKSVERGKFAGYLSMYNKDASGQEQAKQFVQSAIERSGIYPSPFLVQDIMDKGFDQTRLLDYAAMLAGAGVVTRSDAKEKTKVLNKILNVYTIHLMKLAKHQQGANPMSQDEYDSKKKFFEDQYNAKVARIQAMLQKQADAKQNSSAIKWDTPKGGTP
jgi:hypothetical protein